jgi:coenzyme F420-0:L-glutamate ligase / coenzyme F420-1:gamma-L-glutamate ligase
MPCWRRLRPSRERRLPDPVIAILPVEGLAEIGEGDDLGAMIASAVELAAGDVVVVAQKAVSKTEGRVVRLDGVEPSRRARELAGPETDLRQLEVILSESVRIVRSRAGLVIAETRHGFVCASAGVDHSNAAQPDTVILLPLDPDASARRIRAALADLTGLDVAVVVTDSFGRPFRRGTTDVAIGVAGLAPLRDLRGSTDRAGEQLRSTQVAVADEIAAAADLVRTTKADGIPVVIVRGVTPLGDGSAAELLIPADRDLFR